MKRKQHSYLFIVLLVIFAVIFAIIFSKFYSKILVPSYLSVRSGCGDISEQELNLIGYSIGGLTYVNYFKNGSIENQTVFFGDYDIETIKHEICHYHQALNGNLYGCSSSITRFFKFINEAVCYVEQYNPYYKTKEVQEILNENL